MWWTQKQKENTCRKNYLELCVKIILIRQLLRIEFYLRICIINLAAVLSVGSSGMEMWKGWQGEGCKTQNLETAKLEASVLNSWLRSERCCKGESNRVWSKRQIVKSNAVVIGPVNCFVSIGRRRGEAKALREK